jgi:hypothetical protein
LDPRAQFKDDEVQARGSQEQAMANQNDVRRIALSLPGAQEEKGRFAFNVENKGKQKGFV